MPLHGRDCCNALAWLAWSSQQHKPSGIRRMKRGILQGKWRNGCGRRQEGDEEPSRHDAGWTLGKEGRGVGWQLPGPPCSLGEVQQVWGEPRVSPERAGPSPPPAPVPARRGPGNASRVRPQGEPGRCPRRGTAHLPATTFTRFSTRPAAPFPSQSRASPTPDQRALHERPREVDPQPQVQGSREMISFSSLFLRFTLCSIRGLLKTSVHIRTVISHFLSSRQYFV